MKPAWIFPARVLRVVDGDTLELSIDCGFKHRHIDDARLYGINTPELYKGEHRDKGMESALAVLNWLGAGNNPHAVWYQDIANYDRTTRKGYHILVDQPRVVIRSHDGRYIEGGKYGRWLIEVYKHDDEIKTADDNLALNEWLVVNGFAERKDYT